MSLDDDARAELEALEAAGRLRTPRVIDGIQGPTCVIECTGRLEGWREAFDRTAPGGQVLLFGGLPRGTVFPVDSYRQHYEEVRVLGSFHFAPRDVARAREFLLSGTLDLDPLVSGGVMTRLPNTTNTLEPVPSQRKPAVLPKIASAAPRAFA